MLRVIEFLGVRLAKPRLMSRCFSIETQNFVDDTSREKKIKIFELEIDILRQEGRRTPELENIKSHNWDHILSLETKSARRRYYSFMWENQMREQNDKIKKEQKRIENMERIAREREEKAKNPHIIYALYHNSLFLRIYDATMTHYDNHRLVRSMMFGQKLIIDCSYDDYMSKREAENAGKQMMLLFANNRSHDDPYDLHFCNVNMASVASRKLKRYIPTMLDPEFPMNVHSEPITEKFDKEKLVYLTPHCRTELTEFNHDDIYIIGAMVDKMNNEPLSLAKAKKQGLRMARLPLDKYLNWGSGSGKSLTLDQMMQIMLEIKKSGDWDEALKYVPRRKLYNKVPEPKFTDRGNFKISQNFFDDEDEKDFRSNQRNDRYSKPRYNSSFNEGFSDERSFAFKERKQFDRFKFDLNTWGGSKRKNNKTRDE
ncbi:CLUMA_CG019968, isoform A [Clunio marinus]|uniref:RNA (guanine-9-)-methyltransferase domain-containing protein 1 n=1 Tax=Clunio marinus TaxID=568069 RepID=A0A1J1J3J8_9DIPT|nr:CLUMA_CG019968, isoform A [Clunio marinus]